MALFVLFFPLFEETIILLLKDLLVLLMLLNDLFKLPDPSTLYDECSGNCFVGVYASCVGYVEFEKRLVPLQVVALKSFAVDLLFVTGRYVLRLGCQGQWKRQHQQDSGQRLSNF